MVDQFNVGTNIIYGNDALNHLETFKNKDIFIVTDRGMVELGIVNKVEEYLNTHNNNCSVFTEVEADPSKETVSRGLAEYQQVKPDILIGLGGGSAIDAAKAILYFSIKMQKVFINENAVYKPVFIAIPTTSGTGSEVTSYSVVTDKENKMKIPLTSDTMVPDVALLDERLTATIPPHITVDTGMDTLTHSLESLVSSHATPFTDIFAEKAIKLVSENIIKAYHDGSNLEVRKELHIASTMAGIAFNNASLGINHSLAHSIGATFGISHGRSNAILLPYVIAYNAGLYDRTIYKSKTAEKYRTVVRWMGVDTESSEKGTLKLIEKIVDLNKKLSIPITLKAYGLEQNAFAEQLPMMVDSALRDTCTSGNPKNVTKKDLSTILANTYSGYLLPRIE